MPARTGFGKIEIIEGPPVRRGSRRGRFRMHCFSQMPGAPGVCQAKSGLTVDRRPWDKPKAMMLRKLAALRGEDGPTTGHVASERAGGLFSRLREAFGER